MSNWQLWECIPREALGKLVMLQWDRYGLKLELLSQKPDPEVFVEDVEEIGHLIRQAPSRSRGQDG